MEFEFDARKSRSNLTKNGIDFNEAQRLWDDPDVIEVPARTTDEPRSDHCVLACDLGCSSSAPSEVSGIAGRSANGAPRPYRHR